MKSKPLQQPTTIETTSANVHLIRFALDATNLVMLSQNVLTSSLMKAVAIVMKCKNPTLLGARSSFLNA